MAGRAAGAAPAAASMWGGGVHPKGQGAGRCPQALTAMEAQEAGRGRGPWGNPSVPGMTSDLAGGGES